MFNLKFTIMANYSIFKESNWASRRFDGRRKEFKGVSKETFEQCVNTHIKRMNTRFTPKLNIGKKTHKERMEYIEFFNRIPYKYEGDGFDDFNSYQRPSSNGVGYVSVCPGESGNDVYVDDALLVTYLKKKYEKYMGNKN